MDLLGDRLPLHGGADAALDAFTDWANRQGLALYPAQEEAILEVAAGSHVIVNTPTGSGKSLVAAAAHFCCIANGGRSFYTAPIKALVSEKFFELSAQFGPDRVGMITGDASVNAQAPLICCTAEVLANLALRDGPDTAVDQVVMDEFHYFADPERGWAWQVPLLELTRAQHVLLSATLGDVSRFEDDLTTRTGRPVAVVRSATRPVPLVHEFRLATLTEVVEELVAGGQTPAYLVHFAQAAAVERAQALTSLQLCTRAEKDALADAIGEFRFAAGFGRTLARFVRSGIGVHHAGMLPRYRRLVERLAQAGLLKVICGTDTLGVGINVPIRTVVFTALSKFDGATTRLLSAREFHQIAGRAGRAGFDSVGTVVALAPEHAIENAKAVAKAGDDPRKLRKVVRKKPPPGMVSWGQPTFDRLVGAPPEPLASSFSVTNTMVMHLLNRPGDGKAALVHLIETSYEPEAARAAHLARAEAITAALFDAEVVEALDEPDDLGRTVRVTVELPATFALNQPLAPFALAALDLLDPTVDTFALDVVSVIEAVLEDPRPLLRAQRDKARSAAVQQMKADGLDYEQRMAELDTVTYPRPLAELLEPMLDVYRQRHPWVADHVLRPKSVVREMVEQAFDFGDLIRVHGLARSEGTVLRYLSDAYRTLDRTLPTHVRTDEVDEIVTWLGELVRQVDSSLLDEWEQLVHPDPASATAATTLDRPPPPLTQNTRAFNTMVRNALFRRVELAARRRWEELGELDADVGFTATRWREAMGAYFESYDHIGVGADARSTTRILIERAPTTWRVRQVLDDPEGDGAWAILAEVDLAASDADGAAVIRVVAVGEDPDWP